MFGTRKVLEEIRDLRVESRDIGGETRELRREMKDLSKEIRDMHAQNMQMLRFLGEVIRRNERAFVEFSNGQRELRAESRAQTRALFALIDRLEGGGAAPAGA